MISYTPHYAQGVYLMNIKEIEDEDMDLDHAPQVRVPSVHQLEWIAGSVVLRPQLLDTLQDCTGLEQLVYLYAKVASLY